MRLGVFGIFAAATLAQAKLGIDHEHRELTPADVGLLHTEAFNQLGEIIGSGKQMDDVDMMMEVSKITASFCPAKDLECMAHAYKATVTEFDKARNGKRVIRYPAEFNEGVRKQMNKMHLTMHDYDPSDYEEVMNTLEGIQTEIQNMDEVDYASQAIGLSSISVALESTKLWTEAYTKPTHPLHRSLSGPSHKGHRQLQGIVYEDVILADVNATLAEAIDLLKKLGTDNPFSVLAIPPVFLVAIVQFAIPASVTAAYPSA